MCDTMEDRDRDLRQDMSIEEIKRLKVYGETAIPVGKYKIKMTYSPKYKRIMPQVLEVKGFDGIRVHSLNQASESLGCIGLGEHKMPELNAAHGKVKIDEDGFVFFPVRFTKEDMKKIGWISNSRKHCNAFYDRLNKAGGECDFEVIQRYEP
jgi:hypothetical protein